MTSRLPTLSFKPHNSRCGSLSQNLHRPTWDYIDRIQFPILHQTTNSTFCRFFKLRRTSPLAPMRSALSRSETSNTRWTRIIFGSETPHHFSTCFLFVFGFWVLICEIVLCVLCFLCVCVCVFFQFLGLCS